MKVYQIQFQIGDGENIIVCDGKTQKRFIKVVALTAYY